LVEVGFMNLAAAYQHYEKLPRPTLRWISLGGAAWSMGLCDVFALPMESATRGVILAFVALVYGLRGWEKLKGMEAADA
jgi:hypothetical protein